MKKLLLWGQGKTFHHVWKYIERELSKGYISILSVVDERPIDLSMKIPSIFPAQIIDFEFDYLVITAETPFWDIYDSAMRLGVKESQIIHGNIFKNPDFDFCEYEKTNRLNEKIFGNVFYDFTYADRDREYRNQNISISMGRKSYIGQTSIEIGFSPAVIKIGKFSAISWNITFDLGQNMDHDYHRVMNYGITHLNVRNYGIDYGKTHNETSIINIGSDVWIGKGVTIRGGVKIGNGAVIAAQSYVVKDIPDYAVFGGNPARLIKYRFPSDVIQTINKSKWWNWPIERIEKNISCFCDVKKFLEIIS